MIINVLLGGLNPSEKYEFVSWGYYSQYMEGPSFIIWLVILIILKNMSSSMGRMTSHI